MEKRMGGSSIHRFSLRIALFLAFLPVVFFLVFSSPVKTQPTQPDNACYIPDDPLSGERCVDLQDYLSQGWTFDDFASLGDYVEQSCSILPECDLGCYCFGDNTGRVVIRGDLTNNFYSGIIDDDICSAHCEFIGNSVSVSGLTIFEENLVPRVRVEFRDSSTGNVVASSLSSYPEGFYEVYLPMNQEYQVSAFRDGYYVCELADDIPSLTLGADNVDNYDIELVCEDTFGGLPIEGESACEVDTDCPDGDCIDGWCVLTCDVDDDCPDGYSCDTNANRCVQEVLTCTPWVNQGCGVGNCPVNQMYQTRTCDDPNEETERCISHPSCVEDVPPDPVCQEDEDCAGQARWTGDSWCEDNDIYRDRVEYSCVEGACVAQEPTPQFVQACDYCENGFCAAPPVFECPSSFDGVDITKFCVDGETHSSLTCAMLLDNPYARGTPVCVGQCTVSDQNCFVCPGPANVNLCTSNMCDECVECANTPVCSSQCTPDQALSLSVSPLSGRDGFSLSWEIPEVCEGEINQFHVYRDGDQIDVVSSTTEDYTDQPLPPSSERYCYTVTTTISSSGSSYEISSGEVCENLVSPECVGRGEGAFCNGNVQGHCDADGRYNTVATCPDSQVCAGPGSDGELYCVATDICDACSGPFGLFGLLPISWDWRVGPNNDLCDRLIEDNICLQEDHSIQMSSIGQYKACSVVSSCYGYKTKASCESNSCELDVADSCEWFSLSDNDELGLGVCRPQEPLDADCYACNDGSPLGECTENICLNAYGYGDVGNSGCYFNEFNDPDDRFITNRYQCMPVEHVSCETYNSRFECLGGSIDRSETLTSPERLSYPLCYDSSFMSITRESAAMFCAEEGYDGFGGIRSRNVFVERSCASYVPGFGWRRMASDEIIRSVVCEDYSGGNNFVVNLDVHTNISVSADVEGRGKCVWLDNYDQCVRDADSTHVVRQQQERSINPEFVADCYADGMRDDFDCLLDFENPVTVVYVPVNSSTVRPFGHVIHESVNVNTWLSAGQLKGLVVIPRDNIYSRSDISTFINISRNPAYPPTGRLSDLAGIVNALSDYGQEHYFSFYSRDPSNNLELVKNFGFTLLPSLEDGLNVSTSIVPVHLEDEDYFVSNVSVYFHNSFSNYDGWVVACNATLRDGDGNIVNSPDDTLKYVTFQDGEPSFRYSYLEDGVYSLNLSCYDNHLQHYEFIVDFNPVQDMTIRNTLPKGTVHRLGEDVMLSIETDAALSPVCYFTSSPDYFPPQRSFNPETRESLINNYEWVEFEDTSESDGNITHTHTLNAGAEGVYKYYARCEFSGESITVSNPIPSGGPGLILCYDADTADRYCLEQGYSNSQINEYSSGSTCAFYSGGWSVDSTGNIITSITCSEDTNHYFGNLGQVMYFGVDETAPTVMVMRNDEPYDDSVAEERLSFNLICEDLPDQSFGSPLKFGCDTVAYCFYHESQGGCEPQIMRGSSTSSIGPPPSPQASYLRIFANDTGGNEGTVNVPLNLINLSFTPPNITFAWQDGLKRDIPAGSLPMHPEDRTLRTGSHSLGTVNETLPEFSVNFSESVGFKATLIESESGIERVLLESNGRTFTFRSERHLADRDYIVKLEAVNQWGVRMIFNVSFTVEASDIPILVEAPSHSLLENQHFIMGQTPIFDLSFRVGRPATCKYAPYPRSSSMTTEQFYNSITASFNFVMDSDNEVATQRDFNIRTLYPGYVEGELRNIYVACLDEDGRYGYSDFRIGYLTTPPEITVTPVPETIRNYLGGPRSEITIETDYKSACRITSSPANLQAFFDPDKYFQAFNAFIGQEADFTEKFSTVGTFSNSGFTGVDTYTYTVICRNLADLEDRVDFSVRTDLTTDRRATIISPPPGYSNHKSQPVQAAVLNYDGQSCSFTVEQQFEENSQPRTGTITRTNTFHEHGTVYNSSGFFDFGVGTFILTVDCGPDVTSHSVTIEIGEFNAGAMICQPGSDRAPCEFPIPADQCSFDSLQEGESCQVQLGAYNTSIPRIYLNFTEEGVTITDYELTGPVSKSMSEINAGRVFGSAWYLDPQGYLLEGDYNLSLRATNSVGSEMNLELSFEVETGMMMIWVEEPGHPLIERRENQDFAVGQNNPFTLTIGFERPVDACVFVNEASLEDTSLSAWYSFYEDLHTPGTPYIFTSAAGNTATIQNFNINNYVPGYEEYDESIYRHVICRELDDEFSVRRIHVGVKTINPVVNVTREPGTVRYIGYPYSNVTVNVDENSACIITPLNAPAGWNYDWPFEFNSLSDFKKLFNQNIRLHDEGAFNYDYNFNAQCYDLAGRSTTHPFTIQSRLVSQQSIQIIGPRPISTRVQQDVKVQAEFLSQNIECEFRVDGGDWNSLEFFGFEDDYPVFAWENYNFGSPGTKNIEARCTNPYAEASSSIEIVEFSAGAMVCDPGNPDVPCTFPVPQDECAYTPGGEECAINRITQDIASSKPTIYINYSNPGVTINDYYLEPATGPGERVEVQRQLHSTSSAHATHSFTPIPHLANRKYALIANATNSLGDTLVIRVEFTVEVDGIRLIVVRPSHPLVSQPDFAVSTTTNYDIELELERPATCKYNNLPPTNDYQDEFSEWIGEFTSTRNGIGAELNDFNVAAYTGAMEGEMKELHVLCEEDDRFSYAVLIVGYESNPPIISASSLPSIVRNAHTRDTVPTINTTSYAACTIENTQHPGVVSPVQAVRNPGYQFTTYAEFVKTYSETLQLGFHQSLIGQSHSYEFRLTCTGLSGLQSTATLQVESLLSDTQQIIISKPETFVKDSTVEVEALILDYRPECQYTLNKEAGNHPLLQRTNNYEDGYRVYTGSVTLPGEDSYILSVRCGDGAWQDKQIFLDRTPPITTLEGIEQSCSLTSFNFTITANDTEQGSGIRTVNFNISVHGEAEPRITRDLEFQGQQFIERLVTVSLTEAGLAEGDIARIRASSEDRAGNKGLPATPHTITINSPNAVSCDFTPPTAIISTEETELGEKLVTVTCEDDHSGCMNTFNYGIILEGDECHYNNYASLGTQIPVYRTSEFCYKVYDNNQNVDEGSVIVQVDHSKQNLRIVSPYAYWRQNDRLDIEAYTNLVDSCEYTVFRGEDEIEAGRLQQSSDMRAHTITTTAALSQLGTHTVLVQCSISGSESTRTFEVREQGAPSIWVLQPENRNVRNPDFAYTNSSTFDILLGMDRQGTCRYSLDQTLTPTPAEYESRYAALAINQLEEGNLRAMLRNFNIVQALPGYDLTGAGDTLKKMHVFCHNQGEYSYELIYIGADITPPTITSIELSHPVVTDRENSYTYATINTDDLTVCRIENTNPGDGTSNIYNPGYEFTHRNNFARTHTDRVQFLRPDYDGRTFTFNVTCDNLANLRTTDSFQVQVNYTDQTVEIISPQRYVLNDTTQINISTRLPDMCTASITNIETGTFVGLSLVRSNNEQTHTASRTLSDGDYLLSVSCGRMGAPVTMEFTVDTGPYRAWVESPLVPGLQGRQPFAYGASEEFSLKISMNRPSTCKFTTNEPNDKSSSALAGVYNALPSDNLFESSSNKLSGTANINIQALFPGYPLDGSHQTWEELHLICKEEGLDEYHYTLVNIGADMTNPVIEYSLVPENIEDELYREVQLEIITDDRTYCEVSGAEGITFTPSLGVESISDYTRVKSTTMAVPEVLLGQDNIQFQLTCTNRAGLVSGETITLGTDIKEQEVRIVHPGTAVRQSTVYLEASSVLRDSCRYSLNNVNYFPMASENNGRKHTATLTNVPEGMNEVFVDCERHSVVSKEFEVILSPPSIWVSMPSIDFIERQAFAYGSTEVFELELSVERASECKWSPLQNLAVDMNNLEELFSREIMRDFNSRNNGLRHYIPVFNMSEYFPGYAYNGEERIMHVVCKESGQDMYRYEPIIVAADTTPPILTTRVDPTPIREPGNQRATVTMSTDEGSVCWMEPTGNYNAEHRLMESRLSEIYNSYQNFTTSMRDEVTFNYPENTNEEFLYAVTCMNLAGITTTVNTTIHMELTSDSSATIVLPPVMTNEQVIPIEVRTLIRDSCTYSFNASASPLQRTPLSSDGGVVHTGQASLPEGTHTIYVWCSQSGGSISKEFLVDRTAPGPPTIIVGRSTCSLEDVDIRFEGEDDASGIDTFRYRISMSGRDPVEGTGTRVVYPLEENDSGRTITIQAWARDRAGNEGIPNSTTVTVTDDSVPECDFTPPTVFLNKTQDSQTGYWTVRIECYDDHSGCASSFNWNLLSDLQADCSYNNTASITSPITIDRTSKFCYEVFDNNDNYRRGSEIFTVTTPTTPGPGWPTLPENETVQPPPGTTPLGGSCISDADCEYPLICDEHDVCAEIIQPPVTPPPPQPDPSPIRRISTIVIIILILGGLSLFSGSGLVVYEYVQNRNSGASTTSKGMPGPHKTGGMPGMPAGPEKKMPKPVMPRKEAPGEKPKSPAELLAEKQKELKAKKAERKKLLEEFEDTSLSATIKPDESKGKEKKKDEKPKK